MHASKGSTSKSIGAVEVSLSTDRAPGLITAEALSKTVESVGAVQYKFTDPNVLEILLLAVERGVRVRLLLDGSEATKGKSQWRTLARRGAEIRFWPSEEQGKLHAKFIILDHSSVLMGSSNWTPGGSSENVEILVALADSASVATFQSVFDRLWTKGWTTLSPND